MWQPTPDGWKLSITMQLMSLIMVITLLARLYTRIFILHKAGLDDWLCLGATVAAILLTVDMCIQVTNGIGHHASEVAHYPGRMRIILKGRFATLIIYNFGLSLLKASIVLQCMRFIKYGIYRTLCWVLLGAAIAFGIGTFFDSLLICRPIRRFWNKTVPGHCENTQIIWMTNSSFDILTDILIMILPLPSVYVMQIPRRQKVLLMLIFLLGLFVDVISVVRLYYIHVIAVSKDIPYNSVNAALWSSLEVQLGVMCCSLPCIRSLVGRVFPHLLESIEGNKPRHSSGFHVKTIGQTRSAFRRWRHPERSYSVLGQAAGDSGLQIGQSIPHNLTKDAQEESVTCRAIVKDETFQIQSLRTEKLDNVCLTGGDSEATSLVSGALPVNSMEPRRPETAKCNFSRRLG